MDLLVRVSSFSTRINSIQHTDTHTHTQHIHTHSSIPTKKGQCSDSDSGRELIYKTIHQDRYRYPSHQSSHRTAFFRPYISHLTLQTPIQHSAMSSPITSTPTSSNSSPTSNPNTDATLRKSNIAMFCNRETRSSHLAESPSTPISTPRGEEGWTPRLKGWWTTYLNWRENMGDDQLVSIAFIIRG